MNSLCVSKKSIDAYLHVSLLKFTNDYHFEYEVYFVVLQIKRLGFERRGCGASMFVCLFVEIVNIEVRVSHNF